MAASSTELHRTHSATQSSTTFAETSADLHPTSATIPRQPDVKPFAKIQEERIEWLRRKFSLDEREQLIASFPGALVKHILLQGRLHITTSYICFYAKILGRATKEKYSICEISNVKKRKSGLISNAVKISFLDSTIAPVIIGSLHHRDRVFNIIQSRILDRPASSAAMTTHPALEAHPAPRSSTASSTTTTTTSTASAPDDAAQLVWRTANDPVDCVAANAYSRKVERTRGVLNGRVKAVFNHLFISDWIRRYHEQANNRNVVVSRWVRGEDGFMGREVTFCRPLGYRIGPKETRVRERQRYSFRSDGGVVIELEGQNLDAPYGDYFVVESFFEMSPCDGGRKTLFVASLAIHFKKSTMLRGKIESGAMAETKVAFQNVLELAMGRVEEVCGGEGEGGVVRRAGEVRGREEVEVDGGVGVIGEVEDEVPKSPMKKMKRVVVMQGTDDKGDVVKMLKMFTLTCLLILSLVLMGVCIVLQSLKSEMDGMLGKFEI